MEHDTTPRTIHVTGIQFGVPVTTMTAVDDSGVLWGVTLRTPQGGAHYWFAQTVRSQRPTTAQPFDLTSTYDEDRDEWFTRAGNYGIKSASLEFTEIREP